MIVTPDRLSRMKKSIGYSLLSANHSSDNQHSYRQISRYLTKKQNRIFGHIRNSSSKQVQSQQRSKKVLSEVPSFVFDFIEEKPRKKVQKSKLIMDVSPACMKSRTPANFDSKPKITYDLARKGSSDFKPAIVRFTSRSRMSIHSATPFSKSKSSQNRLIKKKVKAKQEAVRVASSLLYQIPQEQQLQVPNPAYSYAEKLSRVKNLVDTVFN